MKVGKLVIIAIALLFIAPSVAVAVVPEPSISFTKPDQAPPYTPDNAPIAGISLVEHLEAIYYKLKHLRFVVYPLQSSDVSPNQEIGFVIAITSPKSDGMYEDGGITYYRQLWGSWGVLEHAYPWDWFIPLGQGGHGLLLSDTIFYREPIKFNAPAEIGGYRVYANIEEAIWKWNSVTNEWEYQSSKELISEYVDFYVVGTTGNIYVTTYPSGAKISLDGTYKGTTPFTITNVPAGSHVLTITLAGYKDYSDTITVYAGKTTTVDVNLLSIKEYPDVSIELKVGIVALIAVIYLIKKGVIKL